MSHCVSRLLRSRIGKTSVKSGVGSLFLGGGEALFLRSGLGPPPPKASRSPRSPLLAPPPRRSSKRSLSLRGGLSSSSRLASRLELPRSLSHSLSPPPLRSLPEYLSSRSRSL